MEIKRRRTTPPTRTPGVQLIIAVRMRAIFVSSPRHPCLGKFGAGKGDHHGLNEAAARAICGIPDSDRPTPPRPLLAAARRVAHHKRFASSKSLLRRQVGCTADVSKRNNVTAASERFTIPGLRSNRFFFISAGVVSVVRCGENTL